MMESRTTTPPRKIALHLFASVGLLLAALALNAPGLHAQAACPPNHPNAWSLVELFLTEPELSDARQETGTTSIDTSQVQLVQNTSVCQTLNAQYEDFQSPVQTRVYYHTSNRYFVAIPLVESEEGIVGFGIETLIVLDDSLNELKAYGF